MKLLFFLLIIFGYLINTAQSMVYCGDIDPDKRYLDNPQNQTVLFPPLSDVANNMDNLQSKSAIQQNFIRNQSYQQQTAPRFQNQTASYKNFGNNYPNPNPTPKYRKRRWSSQSDVGPMTDKLRNANPNLTMFFKCKKTRYQQVPSIKTNFSNQRDFSESNQNDESNTYSPSDTDDSIDTPVSINFSRSYDFFSSKPEENNTTETYSTYDAGNTTEAPMDFSKSYNFFRYKLKENDTTEIYSRHDNDSTTDNPARQSSPKTEAADMPSNQSLTPTVLVNSEHNAYDSADDSPRMSSPETEVVDLPSNRSLTPTVLVDSAHNAYDSADDSPRMSSPETEVVDLPPNRSITPTVVIDSISENSTIVAGSTASCMTPIMTKSKSNNSLNQQKHQPQIEENFTDKFTKFLQKNSEIHAKISRQTDDFDKELQFFDPKKDDLSMFQLTLDNSLFKLRDDIRSTEILSIQDIKALDHYTVQLMSKDLKCVNQDELSHMKSVISTIKDMVFDNLIKWVDNTIYTDRQIQNMITVLLEIGDKTQNYHINNSVTLPHLVGISREVLESKKEITDTMMLLFNKLKLLDRNLNQIISNSDDSKTMTVLKSENEGLKKLYNSLKQQSDDLINKLKVLQKNSDKMQGDLQQIKEQTEQISIEKNLLARENERLKTERNISQQKLDSLLDNLDHLKKSQKKLEQLKQKSEKDYYSNMVLMERNRNLMQERDMFQQKSDDLMSKLNGLKKLQGEFTELRDEIRITKTKLGKISKEKKFLELDNQRLIDERNALQQQLNDLPKTLESIILGSKRQSDLIRNEEISKSSAQNHMGSNNSFKYCFQINSHCSNNSKISIRNIIN